MRIVMPMAGAGKRFKDVGYTAYPKAFLPMRDGEPMWQVASKCFDGEFCYIVGKEQEELIPSNVQRRTVDNPTEGAVCSVLLAEDWIDNNEELLIINCDQIVQYSKMNFNTLRIQNEVDGIIFIFQSQDPKWSYADLDANNMVTRVAEKQVISPYATVGAYYWKRGSDFVDAAKSMIAANDRVNKEFYVCPVFNYAPWLNIYGFEVDKMISLGTPEDYERYLDVVHSS